MKTLPRLQEPTKWMPPVLEDKLRRIRWPLIVGLAMLFGAAPAYGQAAEYQVKAAMLANFALFVEWPAQAFSGDASPFVACVLGEDPFGRWLRLELGETRVGNHPVELRRLEKAEQASECHMVFVSQSEQARMTEILAGLSSQPALVVSDVVDVSRFCRDGGMIVFVRRGDKVRFELNHAAIARAGLKIDSKLSRVAQSVACGP